MRTRDTSAWTSAGTVEETAAGRSSGRYRVVTLLLILLVAAIAAYLLAQRGELAHFRRLSVPILLLTLLFQFLSQLFWNGAMLLPLRTYLNLGYWELFMVRAGGLLVGYGVPVAGNIGVRAAYLSRRGLALADFTWATVASNVLALAAGAALGLLALGMLWVRAGTLPVPAAALSGAVAGLAVAGLAALRVLPRFAGHQRFARWRWLSGMNRHDISRRTIAFVAALSFGRHVFNFLTFGLLYGALIQAPGEFLNGGLVYAITTPIRIVMLTPGNLGVNEWVTAAVGTLLSFDLTTGLIVALVFRALSAAAQILGALAAGASLAWRGKT